MKNELPLTMDELMPDGKPGLVVILELLSTLALVAGVVVGVGVILMTGGGVLVLAYWLALGCSWALGLWVFSAIVLLLDQIRLELVESRKTQEVLLKALKPLADECSARVTEKRKRESDERQRIALADLPLGDW